MTTDPRDAARQWLAEMLVAARWPDGEPLVRLAHVHCLTVADAILADVEVTTILRPIDGSRRTALLLPAEEGTGT